MGVNPKVSLIMKVYNGQRYLREAIDSVLAQTFSDFELLIIDDGSSDNSIDIIKEYKDERIRLIRNEKNMGLCTSQNRAMDACRGEYTAVMDCDDISYPNRFVSQVRFLDEHPDVIMCGSYRNNIKDGEESPFLPVKEYTNETLKFSLCFGNMFFTHSSIMFRTMSCRENGLSYGPAKLAEDYQFIIRLSKYGNIALLPEVLIAYRMYEGSTSNMRKQELDRQASEIRSEYIESLGLKEKETEALNGKNPSGKKLLEYFSAIKAAADKLGADITENGNAHDVAENAIYAYLLSIREYDMKLFKTVKSLGFENLLKKDRVFAAKFFAACMIKYKKKER